MMVLFRRISSETQRGVLWIFLAALAAAALLALCLVLALRRKHN